MTKTKTKTKKQNTNERGEWRVEVNELTKNN